MKILENKYPMGTIPGQRSAGRYIDGTLYDNIKILAKNIVKDHTWLGVLSSSTLEVGTGKSTIAQQLAEAYLNAVNEYHNLNLELTMENIVWKPKDLIERSFKVPRYSVVIVDEWEDANYWSELGVSLRKFFRKCRQLNLFILLIIPNYFQLPQNYAVSRSVFFIDVHFEGEFQRGFFKFYNFDRKKELFIKGRKEQNYNIVKPNFIGRFVDGYAVNEKEYREKKLKDMMEADREDVRPKIVEKDIKAKMFYDIINNYKGKINGKITVKDLAEAVGIDKRTAFKWIEDTRNKLESQKSQISEPVPLYYTNLAHNEIISDADSPEEVD